VDHTASTSNRNFRGLDSSEAVYASKPDYGRYQLGKSVPLIVDHLRRC
jgi:hypothetical protein